MFFGEFYCYFILDSYKWRINIWQKCVFPFWLLTFRIKMGEKGTHKTGRYCCQSLNCSFFSAIQSFVISMSANCSLAIICHHKVRLVNSLIVSLRLIVLWQSKSASPLYLDRGNMADRYYKNSFLSQTLRAFDWC